MSWRLVVTAAEVALALAGPLWTASCVLPSFRIAAAPPDASVGDGPGTSFSSELGSNSASGGSVDPNGGSATHAGGIPGTGGVRVTGGDLGSGGIVGTGGVASTGGVAGTGGVVGSAGTGGVRTGGTLGTGGNGTGGSVATLPKSCQGTPSLYCQNGTVSESCCKTIMVPGNIAPGNSPFKMGRGDIGSTDYYKNAAEWIGAASELPEHEVRLGSFLLDKYLVTVGRFRQFVEDYDRWHTASVPGTGAGSNPTAPKTGWSESWTVSASDLPGDSLRLKQALACKPNAQTWGDSAMSLVSETYPVNCVDWYTAFAFCIWDGGRLPTEAEYEYAAAGGSLNRLYPWGIDPPDATRATYGRDSPFLAVGSSPAGNAVWGHADMAGAMREWVFDWFSETYYGMGTNPVRCDNCANATAAADRAIRGCSWHDYFDVLRAAVRFHSPPKTLEAQVGFRCARDIK